MARIRTIKPEFCTSEQVVDCSTTARLLFILSWMFADDGGVLPYSIKHIKMSCFPGDSFSEKDVAVWVDELLDAGLYAKFEADGKSWLYVTGWKHQKIEKKSYRYPRIGPDAKFDYRSTNGRRACASSSTTAPLPLDDESPAESSLVESKGSYVKAHRANGARRADTHDLTFDIAWGLRPRRSGSDPKRAAYRAWCARVREGVDPKHMLEGYRKYAEWCTSSGKLGTEFVMRASTFFGPDRHFEQDSWDTGNGKPKPKDTGWNVGVYK